MRISGFSAQKQSLGGAQRKGPGRKPRKFGRLLAGCYRPELLSAPQGAVPRMSLQRGRREMTQLLF